MLSRGIAVVSALAVVLLASDSLDAQQRPSRSSNRGRLSRPAVSPYMNLLRPGASPTQNYYNLVRPQIDQRQATLDQGSELQSLQRQVRSSAASRGTGRSQMSPTGHHAEFMNLSRFYRGSTAAAPSPRSR